MPPLSPWSRRSVRIIASPSWLGAKDLDELRSRLKQKIEVLAKNRIENEKKRKQKQDANRTAKKGKKEPAKKEASPEKSEPAEESTPKESPSPRLAPTVSDVISK